MPVSLISLCKEGKSLAPLAEAEISYPATGAAALASMERDHFWFTERRRAVIKLLELSGLRADRRSRGLDIGCGTGYTAAFLSERGYPTWGIDAHNSFREVAALGRAAGFIQGDIFSIEPDEEFDFLLLLDVLEHLADDLAFLRQSLKFLKPGGVAIVTVPAFASLWSAVDEAAGHKRRYDKASLGALAGSRELSVSLEQQFYFYGSTLLPFLLSRAFSRRVQTVSRTHLREAVPNRLLNRALKAALRTELRLSSWGGLPLGSSLIGLIRKGSPAPAPHPPRSGP